MVKLKAKCTPEEWEAIRERSRASDKRQRAKPERQQYMREYMETYTRTEEYRLKDKTRYEKSDKRRTSFLARFRQRAYGVSPEDVARVLEHQEHKCAICRRPFTEETPSCVDHCHDTNTFRGMLCRKCNTIEGFLKKHGIDPREYGERMARYLAEPPASIAEDILW